MINPETIDRSVEAVVEAAGLVSLDEHEGPWVVEATPEADEPAEEEASGATEDALLLLPPEVAVVPETEAEEEPPEEAWENAEPDPKDLKEEPEVEVEPVAEIVHEGTDDPVRMYLREIGRVQLLTAREEVELAMAMEAGKEALHRRSQLFERGELDARIDRELRIIANRGESPAAASPRQTFASSSASPRSTSVAACRSWT